MDKTRSATALPAAAVHAQQPPEPEEAAEQPVARLQRACGACLPVAAGALVAYSFVSTAWRVRNEPRELAFVAASGALLAALLACLRRAERLEPDSPAGERRCLQAAVWALSAALSCAFAYRVAAVMPPALAVLMWCMTAFVVLAGLFLLVLCGGQQLQQQQEYQALDNAGCDPAGDGKRFDKIDPAEALV